MTETYQFGTVDTRPLYIQALTLITEYLDKGGFKAGDVLPPEAVMAPQLGVSRSTFREAMGLLEREGRVIRRQGVGTFVAEPPGADAPIGLETLSLLSRVLRAHGQDSEVVYHELSTVPATDDVVSIFGVSPDSRFVRVQHVLASRGAPVASFDSRCPIDLVDIALLREGRWSLFEYFLRSPETAPSYASSVMYAINADSLASERLKVPLGQALMQFREVHYTAANEPLTYAYNNYVTDRFGFAMTRRIDPRLDRATEKRR